MNDLDIIKECRQTGRTRTTTKNLLQKAYHKQMTEEIDISKVLIEGDIATIMGEKYKRIEEPKSPVEEAYKRWMGEYPPTTPSVSNYEDNRWSAFQAGYNALQGDYEVGEYLKPQTPEQTEKSLREAFQKAQQTEEWKETQRKIDAPKESWMNKPVEELVAMLEKDPPDCLKFVMGKTLEQIIERWWCDIFSTNTDWDMETSIQDLCDRIFLWLPKEQNASGSQSLGVEDLVDGFNDAIKKIKSKIHNKKVTP